MGQSATRLDHITLGTVPNITSADVAVATIDLRDGFDVGPFLVI
jgi:hypothetical protein